MATNKITVNFIECAPTPANGYRVFYRPIGNSVYRQSPVSQHPPIIIFDDNDPSGTRYEGYVQSDCGNGRLGDSPPTFTTPGFITGTIAVSCTDDSCTETGLIEMTLSFDNPTPPNLYLLFGAIIQNEFFGPQYVGNDIFTPPPGSTPWSYYDFDGTNLPFVLQVPEGVTSHFASALIREPLDPASNSWICHGVGVPNADAHCQFPVSNIYVKVSGIAGYQAAFTMVNPDINLHNQI
jgi:hypothetical protein